MDNKSTGNGLYGTFHVTVDERELTVEPAFADNDVSYRVSEAEKLLFTLQLDENAQWKAVSNEDEQNKNFAKKVGDAIEKLKR